MTQNKLTIIFCVLAAVLWGGVVASAGAVIPVVDQYTEQFPDPGGNAGSGQDKTDGNAGADRGNGQGEGGGQSGSDEDSSGVVAGDSGDELGGGTGSGSSAAGGGVGVDGLPDKTVASINGVGEAPASVDSVTSSNDGLGWLFPALLVCVLAGAAAFVIIRKRNRGSAVS